MNTRNSCPVCGNSLPANAPQGLCPECLMRAAMPATSASQPGAGTSARHPFTAPPPEFLASLFPQLEVLALIGQGGMGAVYKARQPSLDRLVAVKILPPQLSRDPGFAERFTREARALARLSHPNIVTVHDVGQAGGYHYLVMEFVDGTTLRQVLGTGKLGAREALAIVPAICSALQYAHDRGIVHRDIKPENILIDKSGTVKIADFGLAKLVGAEPADLALTGAGDVMGTPHYMAPEQLERPREVDHRADIYSLGVVFYQMLTGELPIGRFAPPSRKVEVDVRLDEIVLHALEKEPTLRYQQAGTMKSDVERVATTPPPPAAAAPAGPFETLRREIVDALGVSESAARNPGSSGATGGAFADGDQLVVSIHDPRLPLRCVKTNQPVVPREVRKRRFEWCPRIVFLSLLLTPAVFIIAYFIFRRHLELEVPLSAAGRASVRRHHFITAGFFVATAGLIVAGSAQRSPLFLLLGAVMLTLGLLHALFRGPILRLIKLQDGHAWFAGASPAFLAGLPAYRKS